MIGYALYSLLAIGATILFSAAFRRLRQDNQSVVPPERDAAFNRRIAAIEQQFGRDRDGTKRRS